MGALQVQGVHRDHCDHRQENQHPQRGQRDKGKAKREKPAMSETINDTQGCHSVSLPGLIQALHSPDLTPSSQGTSKWGLIPVLTDEENMAQRKEASHPASRWQGWDSNSALTHRPHQADRRQGKRGKGRAGGAAQVFSPTLCAIKGAVAPPSLTKNRTKSPVGVS